MTWTAKKAGGSGETWDVTSSDGSVVVVQFARAVKVPSDKSVHDWEADLVSVNGRGAQQAAGGNGRAGAFDALVAKVKGAHPTVPWKDVRAALAAANALR